MDRRRGANIDVNPLLVFERVAVAVDALVVLKAKDGKRR